MRIGPSDELPSRQRFAWIGLFALVSLLPLALAPTPFCSVYCANVGCNGNLPTNCNGQCAANWVVSTNTCVPQASANWAIAATTPDITGGTLTVSGTGATLTPALCASFNLYGWITADTTVTISHTGITTPFFQMTANVMVFLEDVWATWGPTSNAFFLKFNAITTTKTLSGKVASEKYCGNGPVKEYDIRLTQLYNYNATATALTWTISNNGSNNTALWAFKEFILVMRKCHALCTACFNIFQTTCYACVSPNWLSGSTCNTTCNAGYGVSSVTGVCILCDVHCSACALAATTCSACTVAGINNAFLSGTTCVNPCPAAQFGNTVTRTCDACNVNCTSCKNTANYCTACVSGWGWSNYVCYSPCPPAFFSSNSSANCTACSPYCTACSGTAATCSACVLSGQYASYLLGTSCLRFCPSGTYPSTNGGAGPNVCLACDVSCAVCTSNPSPCTVCSPNYFLYQSACTATCPTGFFSYVPTGQCLDCSVNCVFLTLNMYFPTTQHTSIYIDLLFTRNLPTDGTLNQQTFQAISIASTAYTLSMFTVTYQTLSASSYRIILAPVSYIFLVATVFSVTVESQPSPNLLSLDGMPFHPSVFSQTASLTWALINGPPYNAFELNLMDTFATASERINTFFNYPGLQEIKKSGLLTMFFSGSQPTAYTVMLNYIPPQNLYEGSRFWSSFVLFDVPDYEANSSGDRLVLYPEAAPIVNSSRRLQKGLEGEALPSRLLFDVTTLPWRMQRTGQNSIFLLDYYALIFLLGIGWVGLVISRLPCLQKHAHRFFTFFHRAHEASLMYVGMAVILETQYVTMSSPLRMASIVACFLVCVYLVIYELYVYSQLLRYPFAHIGTPAYERLITRFGCLISNLRHQHYEVRSSTQPLPDCSPLHLLRPYCFHVLSSLKRILMAASVPLFYDYPYAQVGALISLQFLEFLRILVVRPFQSAKRNALRATLDLTLCLFFASHFIEIFLLAQVVGGSSSSLGTLIYLYQEFGWIGFGLCMIYNMGNLCFFLYDFFSGSHRDKVDAIRSQYYAQELKTYKSLYPDDLTHQAKLARYGNLRDRPYRAKELRFRIQSLLVRRRGPEEYLVEERRLKRLQKTKRNQVVGEGDKTLSTWRADPRHKHYGLLDRLFRQYDDGNVETMEVKCLLKLDLHEHEAGQDIVFNQDDMHFRIKLTNFTGKSRQLDFDLLEGFPLE